jgi:hypothetical protein
MLPSLDTKRADLRTAGKTIPHGAATKPSMHTRYATARSAQFSASNSLAGTNVKPFRSAASMIAGIASIVVVLSPPESCTTMTAPGRIARDIAHAMKREGGR